MNYEVGLCGRNIVACFKVMSQHVAESTEENDRASSSGWWISQPGPGALCIKKNTSDNSI